LIQNKSVMNIYTSDWDEFCDTFVSLAHNKRVKFVPVTL
jgi:hypothetical protein